MTAQQAPSASLTADARHWAMSPSGLWIPITADVNGNLNVNVAAGGASGGTSSSFGSALPSTGTAAGFKKSSDSTMQPGLVDDSGYLKVNVAAGGAGGGAVTVADGADVAQGTTTDAAITTSTSGTVIGFLRGLVLRLLAQVLDYDTDAGTANQVIFGIALPGAGGPVAGGTVANPLRVAGSFASSPSTAATPTLANVAESASSVTLIASNSSRLGWSIYNDSDAALNVKFGSAASATSFVTRLLPRAFVSDALFAGAIYTGIITGIWDSTPGTAGHVSARTTELTA
jgi:hypothetical protein